MFKNIKSDVNLFEKATNLSETDDHRLDTVLAILCGMVTYEFEGSDLFMFLKGMSMKRVF